MVKMIGRTISHYEILDKLGEGGMGVVYKARDTQLDRLVAIKILPAEKVADPERRQRFAQEARAASALNHPNIVTIYDIGSVDGVDFIVMEYVAGRTLDRLIPRGGMKVAELLRIAIPVADALARAHAAGIVHRDLKPGNIIIADDDGGSGNPGQVKLLDFGLAKLSDLHDASDAELTRQAAPETSEGSILGTVSYMSPEQAEARKVDARSDIFSFGAVLYEMSTGQRAFLGRSKISTLAAILQSEPAAPAELRPVLPRELERIIERCLRKDAGWRYQSAADLKISLYDVQRELESGAPQAAVVAAPTPQRPRVRAVTAMVGIAAVIAGAAGAWWMAATREPASAVLGPVKPLTTYAGLEYEPALSPDGSQVAFSWNGAARDNFDIYVRLVEGGKELRLTTDAAADHAPAWSPDGRRLAFVRENAIYLIPALGGVERRLLQFPHGSLWATPSALSWSPDGRFLAFSGAEDSGAQSIWVASTESGEHRRVSSLPTGYRFEIAPAFSPDGRTLAFIRARDLYSRAVILQKMKSDGTADGDARTATGYDRMFEDLIWRNDGRGMIVSVRQGGERTGLFRLSTGGALEPLGIDSDIVRWPTLARAANRLAYEKRRMDTNIYRMDGPGPEGGARAYEQCHVALVVDSTARDHEARISSDGRRLLFNSDRGGFYEIHVAGADGSNQVALTSMGATAMGSPRWSADGQSIVFDRYENGHSMIYTITAEGGKPRKVTDGPASDIRPSFSGDDKWVYFSSNRSGRNEVWKAASTGGTPVQLTHGGGNEPFESPDGKLLYFMNPQGLWSMPTGGGAPTLVTAEAGMFLYALAGRSIYYGVRDPQSIRVLRTDTGRKFEYVRFPKDGLGFGPANTGVSVAGDERTIVFVQLDHVESDLMLVENFR